MKRDKNQIDMTEFFQPMPITDSYTPERSIVIHKGDARKFSKTVPNNVASLIITSPPYNIGKEYEVKTSVESYLRKQVPLIKELVRILRDDGSLCWQVGNFVDKSEIYPLDIFYYDIFKENGLKLRNRIIWHFGHGLHASRRFSGRYETILWFTKTDKYIFNLDPIRVPSKYPGKTHYKGPKRGRPSSNPLGKNPSDIWEFLNEEWEQDIWEIPNVKANHPEKTIHPCQFPVELVERCILALTPNNGLVFDPYCGVGSSLIAGIKHNRPVMGCDKESRYIDICRQRIENLYAGQLPTRSLGKKVHVPTGREKVARHPTDFQH